MTADTFLASCREQGLGGLIFNQLRRWPRDNDWPRDVTTAIALEMRTQTIKELLREKELVSVFEDLATGGVFPIVLKGTALAYSLYDHPAARPRSDTDVLIQQNQVDAVRRIMARRGYLAPAHCDGELLFCQFPLCRADQFGLVHVFDCHWKISTQSVFADVLILDEIAVHAVTLPALGSHVRTAGPLHALLLACIHPVMHHRNAKSLLWIHDVHLLASQLTAPQFACFAELAAMKKVSAICAHQLSTARDLLGTRIPDSVMTRLAAIDAYEPAAAYLRANRGWTDELIASIGGQRRWSDRWRLLREVALPGPTYMLKAYNLVPSLWTAPLLPILYLHRLTFGGWKVLTGQK
jgi:hypothetical protein